MAQTLSAKRTRFRVEIITIQSMTAYIGYTWISVATKAPTKQIRTARCGHSTEFKRSVPMYRMTKVISGTCKWNGERFAHGSIPQMGHLIMVTTYTVKKEREIG